MRVLLSNLAPIGEAEARFFRELGEAFLHAGWEPSLLSTVPCPDFPGKVIDFHWDLQRTLRKANVDASSIDRATAVLDADIWTTRLGTLIKQGEGSEDVEWTFRHLAGWSDAVIEKIAPDLFLAWNHLCPHVGLLHDLCKHRGIATALLERAILPDTWFLARGGLLGHDPTAGRNWSDMDFSAADLAQMQRIGEAYIDQVEFTHFDKYPQIQEPESLEALKSQRLKYPGPAVVFFPPDDGTVGFTPHDHADRLASLPDYASSLDASLALARQTNGLVVFKPHPSFPIEAPPDAPANHVIADIDYRLLIEWSDVVASTGSGLTLIALLMDRPVLDLANDLFKGKGVCCEPTADALGQAVQRAADEHPGSGHDERVAQFTGWLLTHHLVTLDPMNCGWRIARDAIDELLEQLHLPRVVRRAVQVAQWQARTGRTSLEDDLAASPTMTVLVDFDHTLLLGNSTEVFLDTARPRWLALLLNAVARWLWRKPVIRSLLGRIERDHFRVLVVACLLPWTLPLWRWTGRRLGDRLLNRRLVELVSTPDRRVITVSNGFARIIRPMLRGAGLDWPLVSSGLHPTRPTVRAEGKEAAVARAFPELNLHRTIGVSDSMEDAPFLAACGTGHLRQWPDRWSIAPAYMPFRFTGQAKYNISGLVWQVFTVDLPLVVLAWASSLPHALGMALLFTAMHIVYEWGYWDNQYGRLSSEPRRKRHPAHNRFLAYPIKRMGVLWHIVLAGGGLALLGQLLPVSVGLWAAAMVAMWVTFLIFNRLPYVGRLLTYPLLQCFKYGAYAVVVGVPDVVGLAILTTLVLWQTVHYWAYRLGFNERSLPRIVPRLVLFAGLAIAGHAILDKQLPDTDFWPRFWLLLAVLAMTGKAWFHATRLVAPRAKAVWWRLVRGPLHRMVKAAHHTVSSPHVCYMPFFGNDTSACTDHWSRGAWYLPKVDGVLDRVVFGCSPGLNPGSPPRWMGDYTESTGHFDIVRSRFALLLQLLRARVIVQWKGGANNWIRIMQWLGCTIVDVRQDGHVHEWGAYARIMWLLRTNRAQHETIARNRERFARAANEIREANDSNAVLMLATGPSVRDAELWNLPDMPAVACNTIMLDKSLLERYDIRFLTFGDCVSHLGVSAYATRFRTDLFHAMGQHDFMVATTAEFGQLLIDQHPAFADRIVLIPSGPARALPDLLTDFFCPGLDSTLNMHMLPIAGSLGDNLLLAGFDGRPPKGVTAEDFWAHDTRLQYDAALVETGHQCHRAFDEHRQSVTPDRFIRSCKTSIQDMEKYGKSIQSLAESWTPAIGSRSISALRASSREGFIAGRATSLPIDRWSPIAGGLSGRITMQPGEDTLTFQTLKIAAGSQTVGILQLRCDTPSRIELEVARHGSSEPESRKHVFDLPAGQSRMKLPTVFDHDHDHVRLKVRNCGATPVTIQPVHALLLVCDQTQSTDESPTLELVFDPQQDNPALNPASQALPGQYAALLRSGDGIGMDCSVPGLPDTHLHLEMVLRAEHETPLDLSVTVAGEPACVRRITVSPDPVAFNLDVPCPEEPARLDLRCTNVGDFATSIRVDWPQCSIIAGSMGPGDLSSRIGAGQSVGDGI